MATKTNIQSELDAILAAAKADAARIASDDSLAENTRHTKAYNMRREIKRLTVISKLIAATPEEKLNALLKDKTFQEPLLSIINPESGGTKIVVKEGDSFMDLVFNVYKDAKDVVARINKAADKAGLKLDSTTNKFVRK